MANDNQTDDNEPQFAQDLMKAGYEKQNSEGENMIYHEMINYQMIKTASIKIM